MLILITYDVSTQTPAGQKRLRQIAKQCVDYGQRVQCSVFECSVDEATFKQLQHRLLGLINEKEDSLRFYNLGNHYHSRVEHYGVRPSYDPEGTLMV